MLSELFYTINFTFSIIASLVILSLGLLTISIVIIHRSCRTIVNLLICNTIFAMMVYSILVLISSIYGLRSEWARSQPFCSFRAYLYTTMCMIICSSFAVQAISRSFYVIFRQNKILRSREAHILLILISWSSSGILEIGPFLFDSSFYGLEKESRLCIGRTQRPYASFYAVCVAFFIPIGSIFFLYTMIFLRVRQFSRRVQGFLTNRNRHPSRTPMTHQFNVKREIRLMKNMMMLLTMTMLSGILYLVLLIGHLCNWKQPPEYLYLLSINDMVAGVTTMLIIMFVMNKPVTKLVCKYLTIWLRC